MVRTVLTDTDRIRVDQRDPYHLRSKLSSLIMYFFVLTHFGYAARHNRTGLLK